MRIDWDDYEISPLMWQSFDWYYGDKSYREADWVQSFVALVRDESAKELQKMLEENPEMTAQDLIDALKEPTRLGDGWVWAYGEPMTEDEYREKYGTVD